MQLFFSEKEWVPHFTSIINWSLRLGLSLLKAVSPIDEPWLAIIDHSISFGTKKVFVVLRVKFSSLKNRGSAITLEDCECIGIKVNEACNGENVANDLTEIFSKSGIPVAVLKDGGSELKKGVDLWNEDHGYKIESIDDVGHVCANSLKGEFTKENIFSKFLDLVNNFSKQFRQTKFAFLIPPKLRTRGRYQGILRLTEWANRIEIFLSNTKNEEEYQKVHFFLSSLPFFKKILSDFTNAVEGSSKILKILKNEGLCHKTWRKILPMLSNIKNEKIRNDLLAWGEKQLGVYHRINLLNYPMLISSDIIESLFGKFKHIQSRSSIHDMTKIVLLIPSLCGSIPPELFCIFLKETTLREVEEWDYTNIAYTLGEKKRRFNYENIKKTEQKTGEFYSETA